MKRRKEPTMSGKEKAGAILGGLAGIAFCLIGGYDILGYVILVPPASLTGLAFFGMSR